MSLRIGFAVGVLAVAAFAGGARHPGEANAAGSPGVAETSGELAATVRALPVLDPERTRVAGDWLLATEPAATRVGRSADGRELVLANGLVALTWRVEPGVARVAFDELSSRRSLLRAVEPEARVTIDGVPHDVGGLVAGAEQDRAFLRVSDRERLAVDPAALACEALTIGKPVAPFGWKRVRHAEERPWPPPGVALDFRYRASGAKPFVVHVRYTMYDGLPLVEKSLEVENVGSESFVLDALEVERLAAVESMSPVETPGTFGRPDLDVFSDYAFGGGDLASTNRVARWLPDPRYGTQVNYRLQTPCLLVCAPPRGPSVELDAGDSESSFRVFELACDSSERERRGLTIRRAFRTLAPWCTENPLMLHCTRSDDEGVFTAIDQAAAVGFEMVILSFGSGFDLENPDPAVTARAREWVRHAAEKKIEIGSYSLLSSRSIGPETDVIDPATSKPGGAMFGNAPCLGSAWGESYFRRLIDFHSNVGFTLLEHDGSFPGDFCASTSHAHRGYDDSQWTQWQTIAHFYGWARERGIYLNVPDFYYLAGSSKCGMGYRETNWSLPRELQILHARQNIYDGTWEKTPSMGWMFVPLVQYHGGGEAATIEPLDQHLDAYEQHLATNLGAGVQACYRGPRLFDTDRTRELVARWVAFFKRHRAILESDLIHVRRPDGRDLDVWLHVNPALGERALAMVFNPTEAALTRKLELPLYYAGLAGSVRVAERDGAARELALGPTSAAALDVTLPPGGITWFVFTR
ncbi:MAG: alpha-galactosidase [Planctomycetes bacterium]|nr:alpha-galactosidase [Planctomycetota bacterium]